MSYKTILAVIDMPAEARQVLDVSSMLAGQFGAHVVGVHSEPEAATLRAVALDVADAAQIEFLSDEAEERAREIEQLFRARAGSDGFGHEWHHFRPLVNDGMARMERLSRSCDLIVLRQPETGFGKAKRRIARLLFESGRPVLVLPYILRKAAPVRRVLVAWNGTREASRAVFDALPFLMAADRVEVLTVCSVRPGERPLLTEGGVIATALARHGINVTFAGEVAGETPPGAIIENRLADSGAGLLVMGAYSHSRLHERVFGGVTQEVLQSMTTLTLMSR